VPRGRIDSLGNSSPKQMNHGLGQDRDRRDRDGRGTEAAAVVAGGPGDSDGGRRLGGRVELGGECVRDRQVEACREVQHGAAQAVEPGDKSRLQNRSALGIDNPMRSSGDFRSIVVGDHSARRGYRLRKPEFGPA
jgi:hypothetical protein